MTTGTLITVIITGLLSGGLWQGLAAWRASRVAGHKDSREAQVDHVTIVDSWREQAAKSAQDAAEARQDAHKARAEVRSMRNDVDALLDRVSALEESEHHLIQYVVDVHNGINAGTIPPLPTPPPAIAAIIERARRMHKEQP